MCTTVYASVPGTIFFWKHLWSYFPEYDCASADWCSEMAIEVSDYDLNFDPESLLECCYHDLWVSRSIPKACSNTYIFVHLVFVQIFVTLVYMRKCMHYIGFGT